MKVLHDYCTKLTECFVLTWHAVDHVIHAKCGSSYILPVSLISIPSSSPCSTRPSLVTFFY